MAKQILSDSDRTLHFSTAEMQDHQQLLFVGSVLSQWFDELTMPEHNPRFSCSMLERLQQLGDWIVEGQSLARQWNILLVRLQAVYDSALKDNQ